MTSVAIWSIFYVLCSLSLSTKCEIHKDSKIELDLWKEISALKYQNEKLEWSLKQESVKLQNYIVHLEKKILSQEKIFEKQQEHIRVLIKDCLSMNNSSKASRKRSGKDQVVTFETRVTDATSSYFTARGEFVAPAAGYYLFLLQERAGWNKICFVDIVKDGQSLASLFSESNSHHDSDSTFAAVHLNVGDNVWVRNKGYHSDSCSIDDHSSFSGILFHPD